MSLKWVRRAAFLSEPLLQEVRSLNSAVLSIQVHLSNGECGKARETLTLINGTAAGTENAQEAANGIAARIHSLSKAPYDSLLKLARAELPLESPERKSADDAIEMMKNTIEHHCMNCLQGIEIDALNLGKTMSNNDKADVDKQLARLLACADEFQMRIGAIIKKAVEGAFAIVHIPVPMLDIGALVEKKAESFVRLPDI